MRGEYAIKRKTYLRRTAVHMSRKLAATKVAPPIRNAERYEEAPTTTPATGPPTRAKGASSTGTRVKKATITKCSLPRKKKDEHKAANASTESGYHAATGTTLRCWDLGTVRQACTCDTHG